MDVTERRTSRVAFIAFWVVLAVGIFLGYEVVRAMGVGSASAPASPQRPAVSVKPTATRPNSTKAAITISSIFSPRPPALAKYDRRKIIKLIATGDVIPARTVNSTMVRLGDFLYPFRGTAGYLRSGDITLINLESPLINGCPVTDEGMTFCGDPQFVNGLRFAGVDVACTANNHIGNQGEQGILETWQHLTAAGIAACGLSRVVYKQVKGVRFAFLAYNAVEQRFQWQKARREVRAARKKADVVAVSVHWGKEYVATPQVAPGIADDNPRKIAHWIIDSGADLIIGNHPHHVQGVELYHGHLITYAHGNFSFDQKDLGEPMREGVVGTYLFYGKRLISVRYRPVYIIDYAQPRWANPQLSAYILNVMKTSTKEIAAMPPPS